MMDLGRYQLENNWLLPGGSLVRSLVIDSDEVNRVSLVRELDGARTTLATLGRPGIIRVVFVVIPQGEENWRTAEMVTYRLAVFDARGQTGVGPESWHKNPVSGSIESFSIGAFSTRPLELDRDIELLAARILDGAGPGTDYRLCLRLSKVHNSTGGGFRETPAGRL
jgi:hypothetical protein